MFTISRNQPCFQRSPHQQPSSQKLVKLKSARPRRVQIGHHRQNRHMQRSCPVRTGNYPRHPLTPRVSTSDWPGVCHSSLESKVSMRPLHEHLCSVELCMLCFTREARFGCLRCGISTCAEFPCAWRWCMGCGHGNMCSDCADECCNGFMSPWWQWW